VCSVLGQIRLDSVHIDHLMTREVFCGVEAVSVHRVEMAKRYGFGAPYHAQASRLSEGRSNMR